VGDTVADFSSSGAGNNDRFDFENTAFGNLAAGALAGTQFQSSTAATALNTNIRFFFETDTRTLRFDRDGSGSSFSATVVATLQTGASMTVGDIFLI